MIPVVDTRWLPLMSFPAKTPSVFRKSRSKQSHLYLVRHGQTDWNRQQRLQGQLDVPLNTHGTLQAHRLALHLSDFPITTILTSPLQRARSTAQIIAAQLGCSLQIEEDLVGQSNQNLAAASDSVYWMVSGIPVRVQ
jgi:phosphohistidine phosphatase SixA